MKNTMTDLNNYLFETLERLTDDSLTEEQLQREITRSEAVTDVADKIIQNGMLAFKVTAHLHEYGKMDAVLPPMLAAGDK